jgi:SOS-response transcriptional repressor LexA
MGVIEVPLLGSTAAGQPIDFGDIDPNPPTRPWAASLIQGDLDSYYCVTVRGESMTEADIKDGDHALLKHVDSPQNGEIMLVRHDNSSTLKRIKIVEKNGQEEVYICWEDGSKRRVKLKGDGYEIQGLLVAIERKPGRK